MGVLDTVVDTGSLMFDTGTEIFEKETGPVGAAAGAAYHAAHGVYDVATGDDRGAVKEEAEAVAAGLTALPGGQALGLIDLLGGAAASGGEPESLSGLAGEKAADVLVGEDEKPHQVSTGGQMGANIAGGIADTFLGPYGMIPAAWAGRKMFD